VFAIPGIVGLVVFLLARPQEFIPLLTKVPLLYILCGAAIGGFALDLKLRRVQPIASPLFPWAIGYFLWVYLCDVVKSPSTFMTRAVELTILLAIFVILGHCVQRLRTLQLVAAAVMSTALYLTVVCFHQGLQDTQCIAMDPGDLEQGTADGRPCITKEQCTEGDGDPSIEYRCEKGGMFGTWAIEGRVRYRGELQDPNELSLTICCFGFSFLIAFMLRTKHPLVTCFGGIAIIVLIWTVFMSGSRGGLVVMMLVPGTYLVKRYGVKMLFIGALLAAPVLVLGGRSGSSADESTTLRYEAWAAGLVMFRMSPVFGIGHRNYGDYHDLTAHNTFVLTLAETGLIGQILFVTLMVICGKSIIVGLRQLEHIPAAATARAWGMSMLAAFVGMLFQINTISFAYHSVLWILLGFIAAWTSTVQTHLPTFRVKITARDLGYIVGGCLVYDFAVLPLFLKLKGIT
jgi:O-Antigen ligase